MDQPTDKSALEAALIERLVQIDRLSLLGEIAAGLAHEINQPLTAISTYARAGARLLGRPQPDIAAVQEILNQITEQALRAGERIARLRALVPRAHTQRTQVDCNDLISEMCRIALPESRRDRLDLRLELAPDLPPVNADPLQLRQILANLLRNALEALAETSVPQRLKLSSFRRHGDVVIRIWNAGEPIAPNVRERMFEPFFSTKPLGTGLGLNISRTLARSLGGDLHYLPGDDGVSFELTLPAA
ncbi:MAG: ATP-binding protein [Steroidobacteraceae bacterium]|nr:ATP-binding protein [Steroidobacteraceae bacterium]MDW8257819.1 ATP-binding protein [Gammaproteobacteria bacterium]